MQVAAGAMWLGGALVVAGALAVAAVGPGHRLGLWPYTTAFLLLRLGAVAAVAGVALCLLSLVLGRGRGWGGAVAALALAVLTLAGPLWLQRLASRVPFIHDVTTDPDDPPAFVALIPLRRGAANPPEYDGPEVARRQRAGYPDLAPLRVAAPPARVLAAATDAARALGWQVVASDAAAGRLEGMATTRWFGFVDDVVVRLRPEGEGTRVDVRSKSRVGRSDLGANAARIRAFLAELAARAR